MTTQLKHTLVSMPDERCIEVNYYCDSHSLPEQQKKDFTKLFIQLDDCICTMLISKELGEDAEQLEQTVLRKVINTRGHLC